MPGDKCEGGLNRGPLTVQCPKEKKSSSNAWVAIVVILAVAIVLGLAAFIIYRDPSYVLSLPSSFIIVIYWYEG